MNARLHNMYVLLISLLALLIAVIALYQAKAAREVALSDLAIEENNSMITPLYDQESNAWSFLAIYEISVSNLSGPNLKWLSLGPSGQAGGFLVALKDQQFVSPNVSFRAFLCEPTFAQLNANPKLIRELSKKPLKDEMLLNYTLAPGESKSVRVGVQVQAYDAQQQPLADMILVSYNLLFDHHRQYVFRRGFPVQVLKTE